MGFLMGHRAWQIDQFPTCWPMNGLFVHWSRGWGVSSFSERLVPHYWPFMTGEFPLQRASKQDFDVGLHKLLNKQLNDWWFEATWHSCDIIIMIQLDWYGLKFREWENFLLSVEDRMTGSFHDVCDHGCCEVMLSSKLPPDRLNDGLMRIHWAPINVTGNT